MKIANKTIKIMRKYTFSRLMAIATTSLALCCFSSASTAGQDWRNDLLQQDRCLSLERASTGEKSRFCYWRHLQGIDQAGYEKANWMLRDANYKAVSPIDPNLLDVLFLIQQWLIMEGRPSHIKILSGYRTREHNATLNGAAKNSMHLDGKATDIYIPGVQTNLLAAMGRIIGVGGVGIYVNRNFVHVDTGNVRLWSGR